MESRPIRLLITKPANIIHGRKLKEKLETKHEERRGGADLGDVNRVICVSQVYILFFFFVPFAHVSTCTSQPACPYSVKVK